MIEALLFGLSLGFGAGISPGPLLSLVLTTTLARGFGAGLRVAIAPLISDLPIVLICIFVVGALPPWVEITLGALGGLFVVYLGLESTLAARTASLAHVGDSATSAGADVGRGFMVNLLSPHPWLFWISVGGPQLVRAWRSSPSEAVAFLAGFYTLLVGSKVAVAAAVGGGRGRLTDKWYRRLLLASGALLVLFGLLLLSDAAQRAL